MKNYINSISLLRKFFVKFLILCIVQSGLPVQAFSTPDQDVINKQEILFISIGKSIVHDLKDTVTRVSIGDATVADVLLVNNKQIYILGKKSGSTNINLWSGKNRISVLEISVGTDTTSLKNILLDLLPDEKSFKISAAGDSLVLSGRVSDALRVQQLMMISEQFTGKKVLNMLSTDDLPQVMLEVKVAEVDKSIADRLGIQVNGSNFTFNPIGTAPSPSTATLTGTIGSVTSILQANMQSGLVKILAEPNIMAISGQEGKFLAGGVVFLPVPQTTGTGGTVVTLQQQQFGVGIKFTPTVLSGGKINLKVAPEVSEINPVGISISSNNSTQILPAINTRQASTTVQLFDGQSFAIGGLIKNNVVEVISAFPWLANIPVLGALFRSSSFQNDRSELLIVVTPRIVLPLNSKPSLPTDKYIQPTESEFFLEGKMEGKKPISKKETSKESSKMDLKETPKEAPKESSKKDLKQSPREIPRDIPKESPKLIPKEDLPITIPDNVGNIPATPEVENPEIKLTPVPENNLEKTIENDPKVTAVPLVNIKSLPSQKTMNEKIFQSESIVEAGLPPKGSTAQISSIKGSK